MKKKIAVIAGDGIGPEVTAQGIRVLERVGSFFGHDFAFEHVLAGGCAIDQTGEPLPFATLEICQNADSVLLGAVGGPKWENLPGHLRPESALLGIRKALNLYANIRPATLFDALKNACPLREELQEKGIDLVMVRELTGGLYFGNRGIKTSEDGEKEAFDTLTYTEHEIERVAKIAFSLAMKRRKKLVSVDKANVLASSRLWREVLHRMKNAFPEVEYSDMLVDNCAMQLIRDPSQFDVLVTENMFGDILSDEASMLTGSIGLIPSASLGDGKRGLYEPIHGSAPDLKGQNRANPIATILSCALMLRFSFGLEKEAQAVERAVDKALKSGLATEDIFSAGKRCLSCSDMGEQICALITASDLG